MGHAAKQSPDRRARDALIAVLPRAADVRAGRDSSRGFIVVNGTPLRVQWIGEGWLRDVHFTLAHAGDRPDVAVARRMSPGARKALTDAGIGWVDETGAAEIVAGQIVISRTGRQFEVERRPGGWTPAVLAVAEALLCGTEATVAETAKATGLSTGSCVKALRFMTGEGLLTSEAKRGRTSARRVLDRDELLNAYASAATELADPLLLQIGVTWRDLLVGLAEVGRKWDAAGKDWACTGAIAASLLAPYLTSVSSADVYIAAKSIADLVATADDAGVRPIEGGRLTLRPFPTVTTRRLSVLKDGIRVAPWPRVYADLRLLGVRGEEAAEHLREVINAG